LTTAISNVFAQAAITRQGEEQRAINAADAAVPIRRAIMDSEDLK